MVKYYATVDPATGKTVIKIIQEPVLPPDIEVVMVPDVEDEVVDVAVIPANPFAN